ncbi:anti-sigma factor family protein [Streptomyces glomeratus]|uniref:Zf-HC2 domain-containing protein n=1 Tax=Streptomyces glomeratus TaxID=284452 RepID=A0ABP6LPR1_9ACTN|nr:zf-HC2 domain-containing protein [Streptomyces glomeratus]MCF1508016.1 zf-HC2 domain-containing protein [Streptomyces glomeratus]
MSGSRRPTPAEQHLGDRLSALIDGELGHETRERVLAHLATCAKCKAEADAQRRLKNVFAEAAPPPPSESFLARLQGLPGGDVDGGGTPFGGGGLGRGMPSAAGLPPAPGVFGVRGEPFGYVPAGPHATALSPSEGQALSADRGFRIHHVGRHDADRAASRGRRFAFVAAGAVSLAAIALGGVSTGVVTDTGAEARGSGTGSNVIPMRSPGTGGPTTPDTPRRRGVGPLLGQRALRQAPVASTMASAPLLPGGPTRQVPDASEIRALTAPVVAGAAAMSPLIRPLTETAPPLTLRPWSPAPGITAPGLLMAPKPASSGGPPSSSFPYMAH